VRPVRLWPSVVYEWGTSAAERGEGRPCDRYVERPDLVMFRAVDVQASRELLFRWLCQLRVAPYSYDRIDNGGVQSPRELTPGLERLEVGQRMMSIFELVDFEQGRSITVLSQGTVFGRVACTYEALELGAARSRLFVKMAISWSHRRATKAALHFMLAPGDLVMMRRQLLNLKRLAEDEAARGARAGSVQDPARLDG
jgi:hypothetical protein